VLREAVDGKPDFEHFAGRDSIGCELHSGPPPSPLTKSKGANPHQRVTPVTQWGFHEHDFGTVLADGQRLTHTFAITNTTDRPITFGTPIVFSPCCSSMGPVPDELPARGAAAVAVSFHTASGVRKARSGVPARLR
jgi:hypothetical protein